VRPYIFSRHQNFIDFHEFYPYSPTTAVQPLHISLVRHPVDRLISWYYYVRSPLYLLDEDRPGELKQPIVPVKSLKMSLEACLEKGHQHCTWSKGVKIHQEEIGGGHKSQMAFFCGHDPECDIFESDGLYSKAIEVSHYYKIEALHFLIDIFSEL
jgi:hypothetical protein